MIDLTSRYRQLTTTQPGKRFAIHHSVTVTPLLTASQAAEMSVLDAIDRYHFEERKFSIGIGYHVCVFPSGRAYRVGRQGTTRAHILGQNHLYDGLCFIGTFTNATPTPAAIEAARNVISASGMAVAGGHGAIPNQNTLCPGSWDVGLLTRPPISRPLNEDDVMNLYLYVNYPAQMRDITVTPLPEDRGKRVYEVRLPR